MSALKVFKFGGASVHSSEGVRNLGRILSQQGTTRLIVVVSAMGKTTNALERVLKGYMQGDGSYQVDLQQIKQYHLDITADLWPGQPDAEIFGRLRAIFAELDKTLSIRPNQAYDYHYDQIVSFGEIISTTIVSAYLNSAGLSSTWIDARNCLRTNAQHREAIVDFTTSKGLCEKAFKATSSQIVVTQGFIASTAFGATTTLGREGSDYSAAILTNLLDASDLTIWKDVEGVLNADPKLFKATQKLDFISYNEAIELAYCGAQIIHPKTIKPLQNKHIPLYVKSFMSPTSCGTTISENRTAKALPPIYALKRDQMLISLIPRDFSFVIEDSLSKIFALLHRHRVKVNLVQSTAISFSLCVDDETDRLPAAINELQSDFELRLNKNLELLTIRHYTQQSINEQVGTRTVYLQQRTRTNARFVMDRKIMRNEE